MKLRERLLAQFHSIFAGGEGASDVELRNKLNDSLRAVEPGYMWIEEVFPTDASVVYAVQPEDKMMLIRRKYQMGDDGSMMLDDASREEVERTSSYKPIITASAATASLETTTNAASCGCAEGGTGTSSAGGSNMDKIERIKALIACPKTPFKEADMVALEAMSEERIGELEQHFAGTATPATTPTETPTVAAAAQPKQMTEAEVLQAYPAIGAIVAEHRAAAQAKKDALVAKLKDCQRAYSEDELKALDVPALEKLVSLVAPQDAQTTDFSGRATPRAAAQAEETVAPPPSLSERIRAASKK